MYKGICKKCTKGKPWSNKYGSFDSYDIVINMDGKDYSGTSSVVAGNPPKFIEGQACTFITKSGEISTAESNQFKWQIIESTVEKPNYKKGVNASFALSYAKDIAVALIEEGKDTDTEKIIGTAEKFLKWLNEN